MALRAVAPNEKPPPAPPKTITEAAKSGSHRDLLVTMRDRIARAVEDPNCPPRDLASLSRRLMEIAKEIEAADLAEMQEGARVSRGDEAFDAAAI